MPVCLKPLDNPKMQQQYEAMWQDNVEPTVDGEKTTGQYESKTLIGLAKAWKGTEKMDRVKRGLKWVADKHATPDTHVMGEAWLRWDGEVITQVSQPHAWEQVLFYMAALETYPPNKEVKNKLAVCKKKWDMRDPEIQSSSVSSGNFSVGDEVDTSVSVKNVGTRDATFYVTYSVVGPDGNSYYGKGGDVGKLSIDKNKQRNLDLSWRVPSSAPDGSYGVRVKVWNEDSPKYLNTVLSRVEKQDSFRVGS